MTFKAESKSSYELAIKDERIHKFMSVLQSHYTTVVLGAGLSTGAGIPDFRSSEGRYKTPEGLYSIVELATPEGLYNNTERYHEYYNQRIQEVLKANPTEAHKATTFLRKGLYFNQIISQNVDNLLERSGLHTEDFIKLHGDLMSARCHSCSTQFKVEDYIDECTLCNKCGGHIRPNIVMFEEDLGDSTLSRSLSATSDCEAIVVIGTALDISLPRYLVSKCINQGAKLIVVNRDSLGEGFEPYLEFNEDIGEVLSALQQHIELMSR